MGPRRPPRSRAAGARRPRPPAPRAIQAIAPVPKASTTIAQSSRFPHAPSVIPEIRGVFDPRQRSPPARWLRWAIMSNRYALAAAILASLAVSACGQSGQPASGPGAPSAGPTPAPCRHAGRRGPEGRDHGQRPDEVLDGRDPRQGGRAPQRDARQQRHHPQVLDGAQLGAPRPRRQRRDLPRRRGRSPDDRIRAGCATGRHPRRHEAARARRARHRDVRRPGRARPLSVHLFVSPATPRSACVAC